MAISLEVWGDYALFTRPELKTERVSYDVMTPSAARGLVEAIYWHPGLRWIIDRIHICAPIRFTNLRRNEVKSTISARSARTVMERGKGELYLCTSDDIQQRAALLLRDVRYVIEAHFDMTDRAAPGDVLAVALPRDLGWMLYDMDYSDPENIRPLFFRAELKDGVLHVPERDSGEVRG